MLHWNALTGLLIVCLANGIRHVKGNYNTPPPLDGKPDLQNSNVQTFDKSSERAARSAVSSCQNSSNVKEVTYGDDATITCLCKESGTVRWYDAHCQEVTSSTRLSVGDDTLKIKSYIKSDSFAYECRVYDNASASQPVCSNRTQIIAKERVNNGGNAAVGIVVCVIIALVFVISLCCIRKHKTTISLGFRDTCTSSSERDGKEYDAYVSMGVSETDRKFVEGFVWDVLIKKYRYNLLIDNKNLLPRLDYSNKLQANLHKCRRLVVIFSPSYLTHDWCMYCFNEGLRKIVDLNIPTIFIVTDHTTQSELTTHIDIISQIPQVLLTQYQSSAERREAVNRIRQKLPPPTKIKSCRNKDAGMRSPMLSDAESIHKSDVNFNNGNATYTEQGTKYTFDPPSDDIGENDQPHEVSERPDDFVTAVQTGEEIDPNKVKVHQYGARKDFYSLTMSDGEA